MNKIILFSFLIFTIGCKPTDDFYPLDCDKIDSVFNASDVILDLKSVPYKDKSVKISWSTNGDFYGCYIKIVPHIYGFPNQMKCDSSVRELLIDNLEHGCIYKCYLYSISKDGCITDTITTKCFLPIVSDENAWFVNNPVTAHAGGGLLIGGNSYTYTNSYEALLSSYEKGIRVFELDIDLTLDSIPVCVHDWNLFKQITNGTEDTCDLSLFTSSIIYGCFTPLTLEDVVDFMIDYPDTYVDLDTKERNPDIWISYLVTILSKRNIHIESFFKRFIVEFYSESHYESIISNKFGSSFNFFYSEYMNYGNDDEYIEFCVRNNIPVAGNNIVHYNKDLVDKYSQYNIKIIAYNGVCNTYPDCITAKQMGCYGIQSDFVSNNDWKSLNLSL